jgi:hypothetical protein
MWYCIVLYCFGINEEIPEVKKRSYKQKNKKVVRNRRKNRR